MKGQFCIIKMGPRGALVAEAQRYTQYVDDILGTNASHLASRTVWGEQAGLRLNLVDERDGGAARAEASWLPEESVAEGRRLLERVFSEDLGTCWYRQETDRSESQLLSFQSVFMPPLLRLRDLPSGEGLTTEAPRPEPVRSFIEDALRHPAESRPFDRGTTLYLGRMRVDDFFRENDDTGPIWRYRLTERHNGLRIDFISHVAPEYMEIDGVPEHLKGRLRHVSGTVERIGFDWLLERQQACVETFNALQREARIGYQEDGRRLTIMFPNGDGCSLPNPLCALHRLSTGKVHCRRSIIHGDMHTRNVIVGKHMQYYIDFEFAGVGPTLYDFVKHEFVLWSWTYAGWPDGTPPQECTLANALRLMQALTDPDNPFPALFGAHPSFDPSATWIPKMYLLIVQLRQLAREYVVDSAARDYFAPLCLHATLALRWCDPSSKDSDGRRLVAAREGLILNLLAALLLERQLVRVD